MKIDYCSDPHFDAYFSAKRPLDEKAFRSFYEPNQFRMESFETQVLENQNNQ